MFSRKPVAKLQVIAVQSEKRDFEEENKEWDLQTYHGRSDRGKTETKRYSHYVTIVLVVKDGEMYTKEFNGKWDLKDVKQWENENNG